MLGQWKNSREIAAELNLSIKTIEYYKQNIKDKLHLKTGSELTQFAVEVARGLPPLTSPVAGLAAIVAAARARMSAR